MRQNRRDRQISNQSVFTRPVADRPLTADEVIDLMVNLRPAWHQHAACAGQLDTMFPVSEVGYSVDYGPAIALCHTCPVIDDCRTASIHEENGIWGGMVRERRLRGDPIVKLMAAHGGTWSANELADHFGWTERNAQRRLRQLLNRGLVVDEPHTAGTPHRYTLRRDTP